MRSWLVVGPLLIGGLGGCSKTLTDGRSFLVRGERSGVFEHLDVVRCVVEDSLPEPSVELRLFFGDKAAPAFAYTVSVPQSQWASVDLRERRVLRGNGNLMTSLDSERPAVDTYERALGEGFSNPVGGRLELALGSQVPYFIGGEPGPIPGREAFVPILRITPDQTYIDPNDDSELPVSGHLEDLVVYCDDYTAVE